MKYLIQDWGIIIAGVLIAIVGDHINVVSGVCTLTGFVIVEFAIFAIFTDDHRLKRQMIKRARTYLVFIMLTIAAFSYSMVIFYIMILLLTIDLAMFCKYQFSK